MLELTPEIFADYIAQKPELKLYQFLMEGLFEQKEHIFNQQIEEILSNMSSLGNSFEKIYDDLSVNDIHYPELTTTEGNTIEAVSYTHLLSSPCRPLCHALPAGDKNHCFPPAE